MSVREQMLPLLGEGVDAVTALEGRINAIGGVTKSLEAALAKYKSNPQKYRPQLDNARQDARTLEKIGRVIGTMIDKMG